MVTNHLNLFYTSMSMFRREDPGGSQQSDRVFGDTWCRLNPMNMSRITFYKSNYGVGFHVIMHWNGRVQALKSRNNHTIYRDQGTNMSPLGTKLHRPNWTFCMTFGDMVAAWYWWHWLLPAKSKFLYWARSIQYFGTCCFIEWYKYMSYKLKTILPV